MRTLQTTNNQKNESLSIDGVRRIVAPGANRQKFALVKPHLTKRGVWGSIANSSYFKIAGAAAFALLILAQLSTIGSTISYFNDVESSLGNYFVADPVYFSADASSTSPIVLGSEPVLVIMAMTPGELSDPVQYQVIAATTAGDLCKAIDVLATAPLPYDGPLSGLATDFTTQSGPWALHFSLIPGVPVASDASCSVDLVYTGWNTSSTPGQGYSDTQKISLTFVLPAVAPTPSATPQDASAPADAPADVAPPVDTPPVDPSATPQDASAPADTPPPVDTPPPDPSIDSGQVPPPADTPLPPAEPAPEVVTP